ncbi:MAG: hypothetical protein H0W63_09965 [Gemmatimonadaceae bacterium]|nr:hypothetical protein [Gemmatimonadaceae bacterium]
MARCNSSIFLFVLALCACGDSTLAGVSGSTTAPGSSPAQPVSAQYILASVQPTPFVPAGGFVQKSVIGQCVDLKPTGTLVQSILYTQDNPALLTRETDTWTYTLSGLDILTRDPLAGAGAATQRIGSTADAQITITRVFRNNGSAIVRTLIFSKVTQLSTPCGS